MIGSIIWMVFIAIVIANVVGRSKTAQKREDQRRQQMNTAASYQAPPQNAANAAYQSSARSAVNAYQAQQQTGGAKRVMTDADRAKLEAYRQKKAGASAYVPSKPTQTNQNLNANRQRNVSQPDIVERAKANSQKYAGKDETLSELETQHRHSERVGRAVAGYVEREREEHRRMHEEPMPSVEEMSLLGSVEDLIVKGYEGSLSFERDFLGEAEDMLAAFTMSK